MTLLRTPMVLVGLLLSLIGAGNIYTGYTKTAEYERLLEVRTSSPSPQARQDRGAAGSAWRSPLLSRIDLDETPSAAARSKLDFYRVVYSGGRLLALLGIFCALTGAIVFWYRQTRTQLATSAGDS